MIRTTLLTTLLLMVSLTAAFEDQEIDQTLSPYFLIKSDAPVDAFPLKSTNVDVNIAGVIADVHVHQVYENNGEIPLEAIYVFPGSTRSAVYSMTMSIGERVLKAEIKEKEAAKQIYEAAKERGKTASLLEQKRPNVFRMNVANIQPGDQVRIEMRYTELLVPVDSTYELVFPTVVGPKYVSKKEANEGLVPDWVQNPFLGEGVSTPSKFDLKVQLNAGMPISAVNSPSHDVDIAFRGTDRTDITLTQTKAPNDRDFVLHYQLSGQEIRTGLLLYEGKEENFFLLMAQPPEQVTVEEIPPREFVLIMDVSGSMSGFPIDTSKELLTNLIDQLRPTDYFNVLLFSGASRLLSPSSLPATPENRDFAIDFISNQRGGGGTQLVSALRQSLAIPRPRENIARTFILATDGYITADTDAFDLIRNNLNQANLFPFGIGRSVDRHLIEGLAHVGQGEPFVVLDSHKAGSEANRFRHYISKPLITNLQLESHGFEISETSPTSIPDVMAQRPVIVSGKWKGLPKGRITITGQSSQGPWKETFRVGPSLASEQHAPLRYLWARDQVKTLSEYHRINASDKRRQQIVDLGLKYNLLTKFTSFVAVDHTRVKPANLAQVKQPLPLPSGVTQAALAGTPISTTPEPEVWLLILIALVAIFFLHPLRNRSA